MPNQMNRSKSLSGPPISKKIILAAKVEKARLLYRKYLQEEGLAQRNHDAQNVRGGAYLDIPGSTSSRVQRAPSVSTTPDMGDMSSVISFTETDSQVSGNGREHTTYNGHKVKKRYRSKLSPTAKAKAALVRYLGSCESCKARNVSCPLEHHDVESLERKAHFMQYPSVYEGLGSSISTAPGAATQTLANNILDEEVPRMANANDQFFYPGHLAQETIAHNTAGGLADDLARLETNTTGQGAPILSLTPTTPTPAFRQIRPLQGPDMVYIGNKLLSRERGWYFQCAHDNCTEYFPTESELQDHFEVHEPYERLHNCSYNVCSQCRALNQGTFQRYCDDSSCGGSMEMRILGRRLPILPDMGYFPDSQAIRGEVVDSIYPQSFYLLGQSLSIDTMGPGMGDQNNFEFFNSEGGFDQGSASSNPESGSWNSYLHSNYGTGSDGYQYQGNGFSQLKQQVQLGRPKSQYMRNIKQKSRCYPTVLFALALSVIIMAAFRIHRSFVTIPQTEVSAVSILSPKLGFLGLLGSLPLVWSIRLIGAKRARSKRIRCPIQSYSRPAVRQCRLESECQSYTVDSNVFSSWIA